MRRPIPLKTSAPLLVLLSVLSPSGPAAADPPVVRELRVQTVGDVTYFQVRLTAPGDMDAPGLSAAGAWVEGGLRALSRFPRLVPQDRHTRAVYTRLATPASLPGEVRLAGSQGVEFVGQWSGAAGRPARLLLLYGTGKEVAPVAAGEPGAAARAALVPARETREVPLRLDFAAARRLPPAARTGPRDPAAPVAAEDLEGLWAQAQAASFAVLEAETGVAGFYDFARLATGRKYGVRAPSLVMPAAETPTGVPALYELTTGAEAVADTLQFRRVLAPTGEGRGERTVPIDRVPGIPAPDHAWPEAPAGRKAAAEPLARWVPADNYYLYFSNLARMFEFGDLFDRWGSSAFRLFQVHSRDDQVRERYEKQLVVMDTPLTRKLGTVFIRGMAVTGSDPYVAEGSDVTMIFHTINGPLFRAGLEPFIQAARDEYGADLKEGKGTYHGVTVESYVTPLREVCLYRAVVGDIVIHANSAVALHRVLDAGQGREKALPEAPDFRHLRCVYPAGDRAEDGFALLPDAFIRRVVGPANKIKEKRRREALASLYLVTYGALFSAWEGRGLPPDQRELLRAAALLPEDVAAPDGKGAAWDGKRLLAVSDVYNTVRFATPLLELPIDKVTPAEEQEYLRFRRDYVAQGMRLSDPIALRLTLTDRAVEVETCLVPLVENSRYRELRHWTGDGTATYDPAALPADTLVEFVMHMSPDLRTFITQKEALGDWFFFRLQDSALYGRLAEVRALQELKPASADALEQEAEHLFLRLPLTAGVRMGERRGFNDTLRSFADMLNLFAGPFTEEPLRPAYKGVTLHRVTFAPTSTLARMLNDSDMPLERRFVPMLYHAEAEGVWYATFSEAALKEQIDRATERPPVRATDRPEGGAAPPPAPKEATATVNDGLYVAPKAAVKAKAGLAFYLEWESHRRALSNAPLWGVLFRCGLLPEDVTEDTLRETALHYFGYVPLSPDGSTFSYDPRTDEVVNSRHGTRRRPVLHAGLEAGSPLAQLLEEFRSVRADLRFRDDGLHTAVTVERQGTR
jgi:hypothetical protein